MNDARRKALAALCSKIDNLRGSLNEIRDEIETHKDEEQDYYDNMPSSFQDGDKGNVSQEAIDQLDSAFENFNEIEGALDNASDYIETARRRRT